MGPNLSQVSLSSALFPSVRQRVLGIIFGHPDSSFYMSEIVRKVDSGTGAVERELLRLERSGLVSVERSGNRKHYRANRSSPIFPELHSLILKTVGLSEPLRQALEPYAAKIKVAFVYGSVAKKTDTARSDIDLMVLGEDLTYSDLFSVLQNAETILSRSINPTIVSPQEFGRKLRQQNPFIMGVRKQPKIFLFGSEADLPA